jgi:hypothetical protein
MKIALLLAIAASTAHAAEVVGSWTLESPDSATVAGPFNPGGWLNTTDAAVTPAEAFTGAGILERGWANIEVADSMDFGFSGGVTNNAGADLVMLDAHYDDGEYLVSTDADGFTATFALTISMFVDTGESRAYYFGLFDSGPFTAQIWGAEFDLSSLGIADGDSVNTIRVTATNTSADPIGLGRIVPAPATSLLLATAMIPFTRRRR